MAEFRRTEIKGNVYWKLQATWEHYRVNKRIKEQVKCLKCWWVHYVDRPSLLAGDCWCRKCSHMTHGLWNSRLYNIYRCMTQRCNNPKSPSYRLYGARGVKCERKTYQSFIDEMYESYKDHVEKFWEKETSIDRINNDGNYCKENCRRATDELQTLHRSKTRTITVIGQIYNAFTLAKECDIPTDTASWRITSYLNGKIWVKSLLTKGKIDQRNSVEIDGVQYFNKDIERITWVNAWNARRRLRMYQKWELTKEQLFSPRRNYP